MWKAEEPESEEEEEEASPPLRPLAPLAQMETVFAERGSRLPPLLIGYRGTAPP